MGYRSIRGGIRGDKSSKMNKAISEIAKSFDIETLETRNSDSADFHDVSVWNLKAMLEAAYKAGQQDK